MKEAAWQRTVQEAAAYCGWLCVHFPAMQMNPSGWPDLICFKDGRTILMELKNETGKLGPRQVEWIERLEQAGMTVRVFRPGQWDEVEVLLKGEEA